MKRIANLLDSQQPTPPSVAEVEKTLRTMIEAPSATVDALLGHIEDEKAEKREMNKHYKTAVKAFLEYLDICAANNVSFETLDDCFVGWARWTIKTEELFASAEARDTWNVKKQEKARAGAKIRNMPAASFVTYANDMARVYRHVCAPLPRIIPSSEKQFPKYNLFMQPLLKDSKERDVAKWKGDPENVVLQEEELLRIVEGTNFAQPYSVQRRNMLVLGFCTGYRAEVMKRLQVESFRPKFPNYKIEDGKKIYTAVVGSMKNMPANLQKSDAKLFFSE